MRKFMQETFYYVILNGLSLFYLMRLAKKAVEKPPAHPPPIDVSYPTHQDSSPLSVATASLSSEL